MSALRTYGDWDGNRENARDAAVKALAPNITSGLKSMEQFDNAEILPAVKSVQSLSPTDRDQCFIGTYYRAVANVRTSLLLNHQVT